MRRYDNRRIVRAEPRREKPRWQSIVEPNGHIRSLTAMSACRLVSKPRLTMPPGATSSCGLFPTTNAQVAELVDALASGASDRKVVEVRVLSWAPLLIARATRVPRAGHTRDGERPEILQILFVSTLVKPVRSLGSSTLGKPVWGLGSSTLGKPVWSGVPSRWSRRRAGRAR